MVQAILVSMKNQDRHVLSALGVDDEVARGGLRIGIGRQTTTEEVSEAATILIEAVHKLRAQAPKAAM